MKYTDILTRCPLFEGIARDELEALLICFSSRRKRFDKQEYIFMLEEKAGAVGIVLSGNVYIVQEDFWGNRIILSNAGPGDLFAEAFACAGINKLPVSVQAAEKSEVMFIEYARIITTCSASCTFHTRLIKNMMQILASKNVALMQKLDLVSKRSTREKLLSYLSLEAQKTGGNQFKIPFNRQELADYLSVDRSAMSREISRMQSEGILAYNKRQFHLKLAHEG